MSIADVLKHEGKQLGLKEGLEKGMHQGELNKALEIARGMLLKGMPLATIAELTGLPRQKLTALRKK